MIGNPFKVGTAVVAEQTDRSKVLTLTTNKGQFEFEFTPEQWERLAETAKWFEHRRSASTNGVHK